MGWGGGWSACPWCMGKDNVMQNERQYSCILQRVFCYRHSTPGSFECQPFHVKSNFNTSQPCILQLSTPSLAIATQTIHSFSDFSSFTRSSENAALMITEYQTNLRKMVAEVEAQKVQVEKGSSTPSFHTLAHTCVRQY